MRGALKFCFLAVILSLSLTLFGCGERVPAVSALSEFTTAYGAFGVLYSKAADEGEVGYIDGDFFKTLYMCDEDPETDYAVFLCSGIDSIYECGVFMCRDDSSFMRAYEICSGRTDFLRKLGYADKPLIIKRGGCVFYSTLPDSEKAERIWMNIEL